MKTVTPILIVLSILASVAGQVVAQTADQTDPNNTKRYFEQLEREGRTGQGE